MTSASLIDLTPERFGRWSPLALHFSSEMATAVRDRAFAGMNRFQRPPIVPKACPTLNGYESVETKLVDASMILRFEHLRLIWTSIATLKLKKMLFLVPWYYVCPSHLFIIRYRMRLVDPIIDSLVATRMINCWLHRLYSSFRCSILLALSWSLPASQYRTSNRCMLLVHSHADP